MSLGLLLILGLTACGDSHSGNSLDRKFGISGASACQELNQFFPLTLEFHIKVDSTQAYQVYRSALSEAFDLLDFKSDPSRVAYGQRLAAAKARQLNQLNVENFEDRLHKCSDLVAIQDFIDSEVKKKSIKMNTEMPAFKAFLMGMSFQFDNMSRYEFSSEAEEGEEETPDILNKLSVYDFGVRLDLIREEALNKTKGGVRVLAALPNSPLRAGDIIVEIKKSDTGLFSSVDSIVAGGLESLQKLFYKNDSSKLSLQVLRGDDGKKVSVELAGNLATRTPTVDAHMIEKIAYIRFEDFMNAHIGRDFLRALDRAVATVDKVEGIVIDLRYNLGGLEDQMLDIANNFLPAGTVGTFKGRQRSLDVRMPVDGKYLTQPIVILINSLSASAAEILTQILSESGRAVVVGRPSFGKFIGQIGFPFSTLGGEFWLTVERFYGPSGKSLQAIGNIPELEITDPDFEELKSACLTSKKCGSLSIREAGRKNYVSETNESIKTHSLSLPVSKIQISSALKQEVLQMKTSGSDPQLDAALKILNTQKP